MVQNQMVVLKLGIARDIGIFAVPFELYAETVCRNKTDTKISTLTMSPGSGASLEDKQFKST